MSFNLELMSAAFSELFLKLINYPWEQQPINEAHLGHMHELWYPMNTQMKILRGLIPVENSFNPRSNNYHFNKHFSIINTLLTAIPIMTSILFVIIKNKTSMFPSSLTIKFALCNDPWSFTRTHLLARITQPPIAYFSAITVYPGPFRQLVFLFTFAVLWIIFVWVACIPKFQ